jgi:hypothetical protein
MAEVRTMDETVSSQPAPRTAAEYRAEIAKLLAEMARLDEQMERNQEVYERLRVETRATGARIDAKLADIEAGLRRLQASR